MPIAQHFVLDPAVTFLNHGSFGATPRPVLAAQQRLRDRMEAQPVQFLVRDLEALRGVVKFPVRIKCATLAWNTLAQGIDEALA